MKSNEINGTFPNSSLLEKHPVSRRSRNRFQCSSNKLNYIIKITTNATPEGKLHHLKNVKKIIKNKQQNKKLRKRLVK